MATVIIRDDMAAVRSRVRQLDPEWREDEYRIQGDTDQAIQALGRYIEAGAGGLIVQMPAPFDFITLERLAAQRTALARAVPS